MDISEKFRLMRTIRIRSDAAKLFAILVSLGKENLIQGFLEEKIGDNELPFQ